jgi:Ca-activated chloride channel family protein
VIPLTNDSDVIKYLLEALVVDMMPRKGKFPEKALPLANRMLDESGVSGTLLLVGDGISPAGIDAFSNYFSENDHLLLVLGMGMTEQTAGREGVPLQRETLQQLAQASGGHYQDLTLDNSDVRVLQRRAKNFLVNTDDEFSPWIDDGYYLAFPVGLMVLLWFRKGWTLSWD